MVRGASAAAGALLALGCAPAPTGYAPAVAVEVSPGLWMVPTAPRADGCPRFTKRSEHGPTDMAIYFRTPDGGFTGALGRSECARLETDETGDER